MKFVVSLLTFAVILGLSYTTLANEHEGKAVSRNETSAEHRDMNALYPTKQPNASLSTVPAKPSHLQPEYLAEVSGDKITLKWDDVAGADNYQIQVATDPAFKWLVTENRSLKAPNFEVSGLEKGKRYYWRVWSQRTGNDLGAQTSLTSVSAFNLK